MSLDAVPAELEWLYNEEIPPFSLLCSSEMFIFCWMVNLAYYVTKFPSFAWQSFIHLEYAYLFSGIFCDLLFI